MFSQLDLSEWDQLAPAARDQLAREVARAHPSFRFVEIALCSQGDEATDVPLERRDLSELWTNQEFLNEFRERKPKPPPTNPKQSPIVNRGPMVPVRIRRG
jgi:hypothetical protein